MVHLCDSPPWVARVTLRFKRAALAKPGKGARHGRTCRHGRDPALEFLFLELALEAIDLRSFSNLWFWIALAALWSTVSHWVIGVPFDMVRRAARGNETALRDMQVLGEIHARRILFIAQETGVITTAFSFFLVTLLALLGWVYDIEFAQAILLLFLPMTLVGWLTLQAARRVEGLEPEDLGELLFRTRRAIQFVGIVSIFATSMWGMWINLSANVLGI